MSTTEKEIYINSIYECKPLNFYGFAECKVINTFDRTVVVEILNTGNKHDQKKSEAIYGRAVVLKEDVNELIKLEADSYIKNKKDNRGITLEDSANSRELDKRCKKLIFISPDGIDIRTFKSVKEVCRTLGVSNKTVARSFNKRKPVQSGKYKGYYFLNADASKEDIKRVLEANIKGAVVNG